MDVKASAVRNLAVALVFIALATLMFKSLAEMRGVDPRGERFHNQAYLADTGGPIFYTDYFPSQIHPPVCDCALLGAAER